MLVFLSDFNLRNVFPSNSITNKITILVSVAIETTEEWATHETCDLSGPYTVDCERGIHQRINTRIVCA